MARLPGEGAKKNLSKGHWESWCQGHTEKPGHLFGGMVGCIFHLRLQLGHIGNYLFLGKIVDFFDVFLFWEGFFVDWWKLLSFQLGLYVGKCYAFWVGKCLFFGFDWWKSYLGGKMFVFLGDWWKKPLASNDRGHETSFKFWRSFCFSIWKKNGVNILSLNILSMVASRWCTYIGNVFSWKSAIYWCFAF